MSARPASAMIFCGERTGAGSPSEVILRPTDANRRHWRTVRFTRRKTPAGGRCGVEYHSHLERMAFGFKFGGDKGPVAKLAAGKLSDPEKQQLLVQLAQASPPAQELVVLLCNDDAAISGRAAQLFLAKADAAAVSDLVEDLLGRTQGFATGLKVLQKCRD